MQFLACNYRIRGRVEILSLVTDEMYSTACPNRPEAVLSYETGEHSLAINGKDFYTAKEPKLF